MENSDNRELRIIRTFKAPLELVWEVWTKPQHIAKWWDPSGFTNTIDTMDFQEGGEWKFTMHGPDGTNFPNRSIFKEIIPHQKIVFEHFNPHFITTVIFNTKGEETEINWSLLFDSAEMFDIVVKAHKADDGLKQNVQKLQNYLESISKTKK